MGFFSNKNKPCPVCGKPTPKLLPTKVQDKPICGDCASQILADFDVQNSWTLEDLNEHLRYRAQNAQRIEHFEPTRTVDCGRSMLIDDVDRCFYLKRWTDINPPIISFDAIKGFKLSVGWNVVEHWNKGMPRTPYQSPQLGLLGTIGMLSNAYGHDEDRQQNSKSENLKIVLQLDDPYIKEYELMDESVYGSNELEYLQKLPVELARFNAVGDIIADMAGGAAVPKASATPSAEEAASDILKFKNLLDRSVITQAEFDAKKKQLLGI